MRDNSRAGQQDERDGGGNESSPKPLNPACHLEIIKAVKEHEYIQEGDIMIGGVMTAHLNMINLSFPLYNFTKFLCTEPSQQDFRRLIDLRFAVEQTNKDPARLPNLTLGYHISDSCGDPRKAVRSVLQILSGTREPVPNYSCVGKRNIAGFIGDLSSETTVPIAQILTLYGYSQISYGATDSFLRDRVTFPYIFRTVQSEESSYFALGKLLSHFAWTWVGIITSDDISGDKEHQILAKYLFTEGVCIEFTIRIKMNALSNIHSDVSIIKYSSTRIILLCGTVSLYFLTILLFFMKSVLLEKTLILSTNWGTNDMSVRYAHDIFNCSLSFVPGFHYHLDTPEMRSFLETLHPSKYPEDKLLENIWMIFHFCLSEEPIKNHLYEFIYINTLHNCTGQERITDLPYFTADYGSPQVHLAVDMMSQALHEMSIQLREKAVKTREMYHYVHQLHHHLETLKYNSPNGPIFCFDENREYITRYWIYNYITFACNNITRNLIGDFSPWAPTDQLLRITSLTWKRNTIPRAQCSDNCLPGFRKAPRPGAQSCCYDCVPCSEGEISTITDSIRCSKCPDMEWPNKRKNQCIPRREDFLSYASDKISVCLSVIAILFFLITLWISAVFVTHRETVIVRANNRSLSFLLLVSIKLSFLSVFLFLGRPVDITCMLRIITFGITFSIAVSSLLAKTIMVCVAFKATKPGSSWRKWLGVKLSNSVVLFCSSIQIIICMTWLAISPPFQELDIHTSPGTIIIQCNEGSAIGFYSVIGYMGLLAAVSFVLAFLARSLPDSFNEAKYITFSMLLFCSVWITMIPAYLSTKGKNTVCVEIFAILTSSAGLLACIFLPKCYIILFKREINVKSHLFGNKSR
eukprot:XP_017945009.1 PREDICTED: vomeronasal type-2 receptor 26-like [Xenopus tropicalis]